MCMYMCMYMCIYIYIYIYIQGHPHIKPYRTDSTHIPLSDRANS